MAIIPLIDVNNVFEFEPAGIPQCQINTLMAAAADGVREFYAQPENRNKFEEWQHNKAARAAK